jgi:hypothetical protein
VQTLHVHFSTRRIAAVGVGAASAVAAWAAFAPWDLSEVDSNGATIRGGGDHAAPDVAVVLIVLLAFACVVALLRPTAPVVELMGGSSIAWALLWAWRASVSRTDGANMWPVGFVVVVLPAALVAVAVVALVKAVRPGRQE